MPEAKPRVWSITLATIVPSFIPLLVVYALWRAVEEVPHVAVVVFLLSLIPLTIQLCRWGYRHAASGPSAKVDPPPPLRPPPPPALLPALPPRPPRGLVP